MDEFQAPVIEATRQELMQQCLDVIGTSPANSILAEVLSYFPDDAQRFLDTQEYANRVARYYVNDSGEATAGPLIPRQHYDVVHTIATFDLGGIRKVPGATEDLSRFGYTAEDLKMPIVAILLLRNQEKPFVSSPKMLSSLIRSFNQEDVAEISDQKLKKLFEVMNVTREEIILIEKYIQAWAIESNLIGRISDLKLALAADLNNASLSAQVSDLQSERGKAVEIFNKELGIYRATLNGDKLFA